MTIADENTLERLSPVEQATVLLLSFTGRPYSGAALACLLKDVFNGSTAKTFEGVGQSLCSRGLPVKDKRKNRKHVFVWTGQLTVASARRFVQAADERGWWPTAPALAKADVVDETYYWSPPPSKAYGELAAAVLDWMRLFVLGSDTSAPQFLVEATKMRRSTNVRGAAERLTALLADLPDFAPEQSALLSDGLFLPWLNRAFARALDVRPVLRLLHDRRTHGKKLDPNLEKVYLALCVWTGWRDGLVVGKAHADNVFLKACLAVFDGDFGQADSIFRKFWEKCHYDHEGMHYDNLPVRFLMVVVCMAAKPGKTRPMQIAKGTFALRESSVQAWAERDYLTFVQRLGADWGEGWKSVSDGAGAVIRRFDTQKNEEMLYALLAAWDYHALVVGRAAQKANVNEILAWPRTLHAHGYLTLAGVFLSLLAGSWKEADYADALAALREQKLWILPCVEPEPEWKSLVEILRKTVSKATAAERRAEGNDGRRLFWGIRITEDKKSREIFVESITPVLRREAADGSEPVDCDVHLDEFRKPRYACYLSKDDRLLLKTLEASSSFYGYTIRADVVEQLCGLPNLLLDEDGTRGIPITFERQSCTFESTVREDGGVSLAVPDWVIHCSRNFAVRKIAEGRYVFVPLTEDVYRLTAVFKQYGDRNRIDIPQEGMAAAADVIDDLSAVVPLVNPDAVHADDLPRVAGSSACVARLDFAEGVLSVRIVVRPLAANAAFILEPGQGLSEKLVTGATGSYWLVRDLEAERACFAEVRAALASAEEWFDGRASWVIDDIPAALEALASLKAFGERLPLEWVETRRLNVTCMPTRGASLQASRSADEWFSVKGTFALDDGRVLGVQELLAAMSDREGRYVRLSDGDYVSLTKAMAKELAALAAVAHRKPGGAMEVARAALPMLDSVFGEGEDSLALPEAMALSAQEIRTALRRKIEVPRALQADLRPYQTEGYVWLSRLASCGFGSCLADDMGLGKTLQVIALLLERACDGVSLVVAPSSVCGNWQREINRFAPSLHPVLALEREESELASFGNGDVLIASYGYLLFHAKAFATVAWNGVVLDEAQAIKNDASKRAHVVKNLSARFRVAATGTPVENHLGELWSLFDFLNPGLLGSIHTFASHFTREGRATPELKKTVKSLILRRLKGDVLDDLPEKTEVTIPITLGTEERSAYEGCRRNALAKLAEGGDAQSRFSILAELTRLRRFCCHPSLVLGAGSDVPSAKMEALVDLLESLHQGQHKALVFSQFTDYLAIVRQVVSAHGWSQLYLDGSTPTAERSRLVDAFQGGESEFFLISLKAGGTGLNLTAANYVILLDPWWNPAVENQAADRAHRIGQTQPVTIYRLVASDTVEERVIELHKDKNAMAAEILEGTAKSFFTPEDLIKLFR